VLPHERLRPADGVDEELGLHDTNLERVSVAPVALALRSDGLGLVPAPPQKGFDGSRFPNRARVKPSTKVPPD
jgi:hypothetical protein